MVFSSTSSDVKRIFGLFLFPEVHQVRALMCSHP